MVYLITAAVLITVLSDRQQSKKRALVLIAGFIHDIEAFLDEHPGGRKMLEMHIGQDATTAFFGGVYDHSNAAHNVRPASFCLNTL